MADKLPDKFESLATMWAEGAFQLIATGDADDCPDLSWLGKYTDDPDEWAIIAVGEHEGLYYHDLPKSAEIPERSREYRFFKPYAGGEDPNKDKLSRRRYKRYGRQDYQRMKQYGEGRWGMWVLTVKCYACGVLLGRAACGGIETDSDAKYIEEMVQELANEAKTAARKALKALKNVQVNA